jgi:hypothetical protein
MILAFSSVVLKRVGRVFVWSTIEGYREESRFVRKGILLGKRGRRRGIKGP